MPTLVYPPPPKTWTPEALAQRIDLTRLVFSPGEDRKAVLSQLCADAQTYGFRAVCVRPEDIGFVREILQGRGVQIATVIAFPPEPLPLAEAQKTGVGNFSLAQKQAEIGYSLAQGATELDIVMTTAALQSPQGGLADMQQLVHWAQGVPIKLILETDLLTVDQLTRAVEAAGKAGIAMVKTSTGMVQGGHGATLEVITQMRRVIETHGWHSTMGIKASGGVRTLDQALGLIAAGADILGASGGVAMIEALKVATVEL